MENITTTKQPPSTVETQTTKEAPATTQTHDSLFTTQGNILATTKAAAEGTTSGDSNVDIKRTTMHDDATTKQQPIITSQENSETTQQDSVTRAGLKLTSIEPEHTSYSQTTSSDSQSIQMSTQEAVETTVKYDVTTEAANQEVILYGYVKVTNKECLAEYRYVGSEPAQLFITNFTRTVSNFSRASMQVSIIITGLV